MSNLFATKIHDMVLIQYATTGLHELKLIGAVADVSGIEQIKAATWLSLSINPAEIAEYITRKYNSYSYIGLAKDNPTAEFVRDFNLNAELRSQNTATLLATALGTYNPIENYDLYSSSSIGSSSDLITSTSTPRGLGDSSTKVKTLNEEGTIDSVISDVSMSTSDLVSTTNTVQTQKTLFKGNETDKQYGNISDTERHEHGNMGVSSVPDLLGKEALVRMRNLVYEIIDSICGDMLVLIGDGD